MKTTHKPLLIVMSGPSGVGKSTLFKQIQDRVDNLHFSVSCTTREPRTGEVHGTHYYFLGKEEFEQHLAQHDFIEYAQVHANFYGTLKSEVLQHLHAGRHVILDIDVQGQRLVRQAIAGTELEKAAVFIFIAPPSYQALRNRLQQRATDSQEVIERRLKNALGELKAFREYDYVIVNDDLTVAANELYAVLEASMCRTSLSTLSFEE